MFSMAQFVMTVCTVSPWFGCGRLFLISAALFYQREEKKRQERIDDWDRHLEGKGYRSKVKTPVGANIT